MSAVFHTVRGERWPLDPLLDQLNIGQDAPAWAATMALRCGVQPRTVHRWAQSGLTTSAADRAAIAAGLHPALVWPQFVSSHSALSS